MASVSSLHSKCFSAVQGVKEWGGAGQQEKVDLWGLWGGGGGASAPVSPLPTGL